MRPTEEKAIEKMFDHIAFRYDFLNQLLSLKRDQKWRRELVQHVPQNPNASLLDVATGTGDVILEVKKHNPNVTAFHGVDISKNMIAIAQQKLKSTPYFGSTRFTQMSAMNLELPNESYDCVTISFGLRNVIDKKKAIAEFHRVLKPKGTLLILEFFTPSLSIMAGLFQFYFKHILPRVAGLFSDKSAYTYLPNSVNSFYSESQLHQVLKDQGFQSVAPKKFLFGSCRLIKAIKK